MTDWHNSSFEPTVRVYQLHGIVCEAVDSNEIWLISPDHPAYIPSNQL